MNQFWKIPQMHEEENSKELDTLKMGDRIIYVWMRTHANFKTNKDSFPSYQTIADEINNHCQDIKGKEQKCTENFVKQSVKRLEQVKWIKINRRLGHSNSYEFLYWENFNKCPQDFLENKTLTWKEKDFFLQLQQYIFINEEEAYFTWDYGKIAIALHLSYPTVKKYITALKNKQVFIKTITTMRDQETHLPIIRYDVDLPSIGAQMLQQINKNTEDIQETKEDLRETKEDVAELKDQIKKLTKEVERLKNEKIN